MKIQNSKINICKISKSSQPSLKPYCLSQNESFGLFRRIKAFSERSTIFPSISCRLTKKAFPAFHFLSHNHFSTKGFSYSNSHLSQNPFYHYSLSPIDPYSFYIFLKKSHKSFSYNPICYYSFYGFFR